MCLFLYHLSEIITFFTAVTSKNPTLLPVFMTSEFCKRLEEKCPKKFVRNNKQCTNVSFKLKFNVIEHNTVGTFLARELVGNNYLIFSANAELSA